MTDSLPGVSIDVTRWNRTIQRRMWLPFSWIIQHWIGIFHTVTRTVLVTAAWYFAPHHRFVVIPAVIVGVYVVTIVVLEQRWRTARLQI